MIELKKAGILANSKSLDTVERDLFCKPPSQCVRRNVMNCSDHRTASHEHPLGPIPHIPAPLNPTSPHTPPLPEWRKDFQCDGAEIHAGS